MVGEVTRTAVSSGAGFPPTCLCLSGLPDTDGHTGKSHWQGSPTGSTWTLQLSKSLFVNICRADVARVIRKRSKKVYFVDPRNSMAQNTTLP